MALWILLFLIGTPIAEIAVFIEAGERFGLWPTVGGILATAALGMFIIRLQGLGVLQRAQENLQAERFPGQEIFDGVCLLIAGAMLITPGFITDSIGFLLLIVPLRRWAGAWAWRIAEKRGLNISGSNGMYRSTEGVVINGDFHDVTRADPSADNGPTPVRLIDQDERDSGTDPADKGPQR